MDPRGRLPVQAIQGQQRGAGNLTGLPVRTTCYMMIFSYDDILKDLLRSEDLLRFFRKVLFRILKLMLDNWRIAPYPRREFTPFNHVHSPQPPP